MTNKTTGHGLLRMGDLAADRKVYRHQESLLSLLRGMSGSVLTMAEIGVFAGATSEYLLRHEPRLELLMVDPWHAAPSGSTYAKSRDRVARLPQDQMDALAELATHRTALAGKRRSILRRTSADAAAQFGSTSPMFNLVFIDAEHTYEACRADMAAWWPLVKPGGILCGHDYGHRRYPGVARAVDEFAASKGLAIETRPGKVWLVFKMEGDGCPSGGV